MFIGDWLVDVIAGERFFNLRLLWMWLHVVDEAEYKRPENRRRGLNTFKKEQVFTF